MVKRERFSVRINADLKRRFQDTVRRKGLSTCYVIEAFMEAWLQGIKANPSDSVRHCPTLNVVLQRVTQRVRRKTIEHEPEANHYKCPPGIWVYDPSHPDMVVVEQPFEWGKNRCVEGFTWNEARHVWWKFVT